MSKTNSNQAVQELRRLFDIDYGLLDKKDWAFVWVASRSVDGRSWGSFKSINRNWLCGREYTLGLTNTFPTTVMIELLDTVYDPGTYSNDVPLNPRGSL